MLSNVRSDVTPSQGLTKSEEHYKEAVQCLETRNDRPRMVHQTHVRQIVEAPIL